ncbi:MAG: formimidoylglutamase [Bacteroidetes bacterium]|nr:formimidoylglutamase [Bacteroidota bacterium]
MNDIQNLKDFLEPIGSHINATEIEYADGQLGKLVEKYEDEFPDFFEKDIIIVGCGEIRGKGPGPKWSSAPDAIRDELYKLYCWHTDIKIADAGNIKPGASLNDTHAALKTVIRELLEYGKTIVVLGGSCDLTLAQYQTYVDNKKIVEAVCVDALINLNIEAQSRSGNYLMEMLTTEPNYIRHYNHIGFQSYYVHPRMLETMDKLRFDCFRVGSVKENIEEMEPVIRNCSLFSFDISAIAHAFAPSNSLSPNGFNGEEACTLMRYAGLSPNVNTVGIYGYEPEKDHDQLTAKQISHMLWYLIDGKSRGRREARLDEKDSFIEYHTAFAEVETIFLKSRKTNRWWMQLPDKKYIACSYKDYLLASSNEIPERWMRAQERV